jgi:translocation and assembly module TamB
MSMPKARRFKKRWLLLSALMLACVTWGVLRHPDVQKLFHARLAQAIRHELGLDVDIGPVHFELPNRFVAQHLALKHPTEGLLVSATRIEVAPSLSAALRGELELTQIRIEGAYVRLRVVDGRITNLGTPRARPASTNTKLPFDELLVHDAHLAVDGSPSFSGSIEKFNAALRVSEGTRVNLSASAGTGHITHAGGREQLSSFDVSARIAPDALNIDRLHAQTTLLSLEAEKVRVGLPLEHGRYTGHIKLQTELQKLATLPHGLSLPPVDGQLGLDLNIEGIGPRYHARGRVEVDDAHLDGFGFGELSLNVDATPEEVQLLEGSQGKIIEGGGVVSLQGRMSLLDAMPIQLAASVEQLQLEKLMRQLDVTDDCVVRWLLEGGFKIDGTLNPVAISGPIWANHLKFSTVTTAWHDPHAREVIGTPPGRVAGRVTITPSALRFENLVGRLPHSTMQVTVHIGFDDKLGVLASSDEIDMRDATGLMGMPIAGRGKFRLEVGGTYDNTWLTGSLNLAGFELDGFRIGDIDTEVVLEKEGLAARFSKSVITKNDSRYIIDDMVLDFSEEFTIDATTRIAMLSTADFYHTFHLEDDPDFSPYQALLRGTAKVRYTLGFPGDDADGTLTADADLDVLEGSARGVSFSGGRLAGRYVWEHISQGTRGVRLALEELHATKGKGALHVSGTMNPGGLLDMTVVAEQLSIRELDFLAKSSSRINGEVDAVGKISGSLWVPDVTLETDIVNFTLEDRALGDLRTTVRIVSRDHPWVQQSLQTAPNGAGTPDSANKSCLHGRQGLARATWQSDESPDDGIAVPPLAYLLCGGGLENRLALDLALGMADGVPARGEVKVDNVPMAWIFPRPKRSEAPITGDLSARALLQDGFLAKPDSLVGEIVVGKVRVGRDDAWIQGDGPQHIRLTGRGALIERGRFVGNGSVLTATGGVSLARGLQTNLAGQVDLAALTGLIPGVARMRGQLSLDVKLSGAPSSPSVFGRASLRDGFLAVTALPRPIEKVSADLSFSERELLLEQLSGSLGGGTVLVRGSAAIGKKDELSRYEFFVSARDLNIDPYEGVGLAISADTQLSYTSNARIPKLTGTVRVLRARYARPFSLGISERLTGISSAKRVVRETYDPALDRVALDLTIVDDAPIRVTNNLLTAELTIEDSERPFRLVGTDQRWGAIGTLELTRGILRFRNSEFTIDHGTVSFDDEYRLSPRLDVHARTELRRTADASGARWLIALHAMGEADNLKLETSSEPALAQEDIALLLTVGLTRAEAERLGAGDLTGGAALEALATVTGVDREVKRALPVIDDFNVTSAYSARSNRTEPQIVVGKRLGDKVRATATTGLSTDSNFKTGVEWRFDDQTSVEAAYDNVQTTTSSQFGNVGVDLRWRLEFD